MNLPIYFNLFGHTIYLHLITDIISTSVGAWLYWKISKGDGITSQKREYLLLGAALGGLIGSRLLGALENPQLFLHPPDLLYYYANKTIIGGIAGGILGVELVKKIINQKESTGDKITLPLIVAIIIGRIGCLFTGVTDGTVGNICSYFWCFDQGDGLAKHPMALYEIIFLLFFIIFLRFYLKKLDLKSGIIFRLFIILYFSLRFFLEFIKPTKALFLNLSAIQIICASFVLWYYYDIRRNYKNGE